MAKAPRYRGYDDPAFDGIAKAQGVLFKGQNVTMLTHVTGSDNPITILPGQTVPVGKGKVAFGPVDFEGYGAAEIVIDLSLPAGQCTITIEQSQDGADYQQVPFSANGEPDLPAYVFGIGEISPVILRVGRFGKDFQVSIETDDTNPVEVNRIWVARRPF